jgi:probable rRNA maturation factor
MEIIINKNVKNVNFCGKKIRKIVEYILKKERKSQFSLSINFVGETKIKSLNKQYRDKDSVTDVISFALQDGKQILEIYELGDIFICHKQIKKQSKEFGVSYKEEMVRVLVHGVLHLLGYDHKNKKDEKRMFFKQEKMVKEFS